MLRYTASFLLAYRKMQEEKEIEERIVKQKGTKFEDVENSQPMLILKN